MKRSLNVLLPVIVLTGNKEPLKNKDLAEKREFAGYFLIKNHDKGGKMGVFTGGAL